MNVDVITLVLAALGILAVSAAVSSLAADNRKLGGILNLLLTSSAALLLGFAGFSAILGSGGESVRLLRIGPLACPLLVDGFSGIFLVVIAFMAVMSAFYSIRYMDHYPDYGLRGYYLCFPLFIMGMAGLVVVDDLALGFTISWQIMTLASYFLIKFERRKRENVRNANKYLILMELAWALIAGGAFFVEGYAPGDSLASVGAKLLQTSGGPLLAFFAFLLAGFGMKAGVFPLGQLWLPDAHSIAPSPISSLLSGVMLKTGIYGLMRTFLFMAPVAHPAFSVKSWGVVLAAIGAATLLIGTVQSMKQSDTKRLLAYSSIGQIGYIVLAIGAALLLSGTGDRTLETLAVVAVIGALYHVINHAVFKGLLFLTSGSILYATGTKDLNKLGGLIKFMPVSAVLAGIASLSISGMPPTSGFASKWTIISSSLLAGDGAPALVFFGIIALFTSVVTLACYVKFFGMAFTSSGTEWTVSHPVKEVPASMLIPKIVMAAVCIAQGLFPIVFYRLIADVFRRSEGFLLSGGFSGPSFGGALAVSPAGIKLTNLFGMSLNSAAGPLVVLAVFGLAFALAALLRNAGGGGKATAPVWLCGYQELNNANRYHDRNMFAALRGLFRWAGGRRGK